MSRFRLTALLAALAVLASSCIYAMSTQANSIGSSGGEEPSADVSGLALVVPRLAKQLLQSWPEPRQVLTQADVDQALSQVMEHYSAASVAVATVESGRLSQSGAWGWAVKGQREMTPDTKVRVASLSKVVVAMCAMSMAEEGILDLDAPLSDYWGPGAANPYSKGQPSVRTLMTHTSSLKDLETTRGLSRLTGLLQSPSSWRNMEPGNGGYWYYSNFGLCVLGTTLELASGGLLEDYLQEHFLQPMGASASFYSETLPAGQLATLYTTGGVGRSVAEQVNQTTPTQIGQTASYFPGGFTASAVDMAKLVAVLANDGVYYQPIRAHAAADSADGAESIACVILQWAEDQCAGTRLLSQESVADMETPRFPVDPADTSSFEQCLILRRQEDLLGQEVLYYHTGSAYGVYNVLTYNPVTKNGVVVLTTGTPRSMNDRGLYALCADLSELLYEKMDGDLT